MANNNDVFVKITNKDIYKEIQAVKTICQNTNGKVKAHRRWIASLTGAFGAGFLFIVGWLLKLGGN